MRKLIEFIRSIYVVVLFVVLEIAAVNYYARSDAYTQARLLSRSNQVVGGVRSLFSDIRHYFTLGGENRRLLERVTRLEEELSRYREAETFARLDDYLARIEESQFHYAAASVVSNSANRTQNLITLNRGYADGVMENMSVLTAEGAMLGYVVACTNRYAVAMSVLNTSFRASGRLAGSEYAGLLYWDGVDRSVVVLDELSKYADPQPGEQVVTTGFSQYFPEGVLIGEVLSAELNESRTAYRVRVKLAAEVMRQHDVILVGNRDLWEIRDLQQSEPVQEQLNR